MAPSRGTWALNIPFGIRNLGFLKAFGPTCWLGLARHHHLALTYLSPDRSYAGGRKCPICLERMKVVPMDPHPLVLGTGTNQPRAYSETLIDP